MDEEDSMRIARTVLIAGALLMLAACARQMPEGVSHVPGTPGFWWGLWHGFVFPFAWIGSLFNPQIAIYAVPNQGGWYDFGYFLGVTVLGGGSWFGHSKARNRGG
jgi:hypothetical protein